MIVGRVASESIPFPSVNLRNIISLVDQQPNFSIFVLHSFRFESRDSVDEFLRRVALTVRRVRDAVEGGEGAHGAGRGPGVVTPPAAAAAAALRLLLLRLLFFFRLCLSAKTTEKLWVG